MHCSTRLNGKPKHRNMHIPPPPYDTGIRFLSTAPNVSHTGQMQINRKYINNVGNINEVSVLQYQRSTTNMQIKNSPEINHYQSLRHHQQQQPFVYKTPQYHQQHINPNGPPKFPGQFAIQRKIVKDQIVTQDVAQPFRHVEFSSKKSKDFQNQQEANKLTSFNKVTKIMSRKVDANENSNRESNNEEKAISRKQVPDCTAVVGENNTQLNQEDTNKLDVQQDLDQVLNISNENSDLDNGEDDNDKSAKSAREKTPMCLINDLARFNKISFQYRLTSENGPAHCKRFTVTLKLGDEEYTAEGFKIKKAQHLAAKEAIEKTKYKHPTPKTNRRTDENNIAKSNITPTVELNALAMKLGQQTYYIFDPKQMENNTNYRSNSQHYEVNTNVLQQPPNMGVGEHIITNNKQFVNHKRQFLSKFQNRYIPFQHSVPNGSVPGNFTYFPSTSPCKITLIVGTKQFVGVGRTLQQAKHDAASNALQVLKEQVNNEQSEAHNDSMEDNDNKSPISLVFEIGIKRNLPVDFKVLREEGPAHMRTFITACIVGDLVTEGEGTGKKISKKKAAQKMLEELKKLPPITPVASPVKRVKLKISSKKPSAAAAAANSLNRNEHKEDSERSWHKNKKDNVETEEANPINKLIEWHQNKKEKEPIFKLISEFGKENSRRRQFVMEVSSNNIVARGVGNSKKLAKRDAAQNFLIAITNAEHPTEENVTNTPADNSLEIKKTVLETTVPTKPLRIETNNNLLTPKDSCQETLNISEILPNTSSSTFLTSTATTAKESTPPSTNTNTATTKSPNLHMKDQLMYLAKLLGFEVEFSDYPKGNHNEFLTIVMLSTNPPQICHGVGVNAKESQEDAAKNALKILSEMGLNNAVNT